MDVEVSGCEPGFAERKVKIPGPAECVIEAESGYRGPVPVEAVPPQGQGCAVMAAERAAVEHAKAGVAGQGLLDPLHGRNEPTGEDVLIYPCVGGARPDHPVVPHGHRLQADPALRRIPVVVLTTSAAEEDILRSYDLHANCYITKPVDLDQFIYVVKSVEDFWFKIVRLAAE